MYAAFNYWAGEKDIKVYTTTATKADKVFTILKN
ncbi:hypothetical protein [Candidatus Villigracilis affinis]